MAKENKRNRYLIYILLTTLIITIFINIIITININLVQNETNILKDNYNNLNINKNYIENEYNTLNEKLSNILNIDDNINNIKNDFFNKAKTLEDKILSGESDKKIAYLTFDDGPYNLTYQFLDVLDRYDIFATFFTIGLNKDDCFDYRGHDCSGIYALEASKGHTMANHTYSHAIFKGLYNSTDSFIEQVKMQEDLIYKRTGTKTNIVRFPGGSATAGHLKYEIIDRLRDTGYGWVDWSSSIGDGGNLRNYDIGWNNFINSINSNIEVVLMHDYNKITLQLLPNEIEYLKNNGYYIFPLFYESNMVNK